MIGSSVNRSIIFVTFVSQNGSSWYRDVEIITLKNLSALVTSVLLAERANSSWVRALCCVDSAQNVILLSDPTGPLGGLPAQCATVDGSRPLRAAVERPF